MKASDERRGSSTKRGYGYRWQKARDVWMRNHSLCVMCSTVKRSVPATLVDHIVPHRLKEAEESGDPVWIAEARRLFWSRSNWQSLCTSCHSSHKQRLEKSGRVAGCDATGIPLDPRHHWNR